MRYLPCPVGVDADILLRVSEGEDDYCEGTVAYAEPLLSSADAERRPMMGLVSVCPSEIRGNRRLDLEVLVHEMIHALVRPLAPVEWQHLVFMHHKAVSCLGGDAVAVLTMMMSSTMSLLYID